MLIMNADDWGADAQTTNRIYECVKHGTVSSVSAMVFMEDSHRAADAARKAGIVAGLHLNFTAELTAQNCSQTLLEHQRRIRRFLRHRGAQAVFHPGLTASFEYLVKAQCDEFASLYGRHPERIDGHHHMHLCANVVLQQLLPHGIAVRRSFSFRRGEKPFWNRLYRRLIDDQLERRHRITDYFFNLAPLEPPERLHRIFSLATHSCVEVETHPGVLNQYTFLTSGEIFRHLGNVVIANEPTMFAVRSARMASAS